MHIALRPWIRPLCALSVLAPSTARAADTLIYVRASSQYERAADPSRYHPLNLLDDDPATIWCGDGDKLGEGEEIRYHFRAPQKIDRIVIGPTPKSGRIIEAVRVSDGTSSVRVVLDERYADQSLKTPLEGDTYTVTIERVLGPNKGSALPAGITCLAEALLYYNGRLFGGRTPPSKLRFDRMRDLILGRWHGPPFGASESTLTFGLDGTWDWVYHPLLGGTGDSLHGEYRFRGDRLLMRRGEAGRWRDVSLLYRRVKVDPGAYSGPTSDYDRLTINGAVGPKMVGNYDNAQL